MPYVDLAGLSRFAGKSKDFASSAFAGPDMANWQRTAAAGAVSFAPVPEMPLDPVVNFIFSETGPASGTKSPDNPSTVIGVSNVKVWRAGDNILPGNRKSNYSGEAGTFSTDADGYVSYSAMSDGRAFVYSLCNAQVYLHAGQQYVLRTEVKTAATSTYRTVHILDEDNTSVLSVSPGDSDNSHTFTPSHDGMYGVLYKIYDGTYRFSLYLGSTAASFEPYAGTDYTVNLGGTYYGGSVDLSAGVMTVTWDSFTFDGTEGWQSSNTYLLSDTAGFYLGNSQLVTLGMSCASGLNPIACPMFPLDASFVANTQNIYKSDNGSLMIRVENSSLSSYGYVYGVSTLAESVASFKGWLSDNNVIVFYKRATPYTVQLSPQQILSLSQPDSYVPCINTVYSDQVSVQVGYPKSPQATQNELTSAIVSLGGNL